MSSKPLNGSGQKRPSAEQHEASCQNKPGVDPQAFLTREYLTELHPFLTPEQVADLLNFCARHTIRLVGCYGDGSIMLPKFLASSPA